MLTRESDLIVESTVNAQANVVAQQFGIAVPPEVRNLLTVIVKESLIWRENEWLEKQQLDINAPHVIEGDDFRNRLTENLGKALMGSAETDDLARQDKRLSVIGIIDWIRQNWCGVFPLCR